MIYRYHIYASPGIAKPKDRVSRFVFKKRAVRFANGFACDNPELFVHVVDRWRFGKIIHTIKADADSMHGRDQRFVPCFLYGKSV
jgi:hypothetical protein